MRTTPLIGTNPRLSFPVLNKLFASQHGLVFFISSHLIRFYLRARQSAWLLARAAGARAHIVAYI